MRRGISTLLTATIVAAVALSVFTALFTISYRRTSTSVSSLWGLVEYTDLHEVTKLAIIVRGDIATLRNIGRSPVELEYIVFDTSNGVEVLRLDLSDRCRILKINEACEVSLGRGTLIAAITKSGVIVFPERVSVEVGTAEAALIIPITFSFRNLGDIAEEFEIHPELIAKPYPGQSGKRGVNGSTVLILPRGREDEYYNEEINTKCSKDDRISFGVLVVGYDPSWVMEKGANPGAPPRYTILIAGPKSKGQEKLCIGGRSIPLTEQGFRAKIANFTGTIKIYDSGGRVVACSSSNPSECVGYRSAIGTWYYKDSGWQLFMDGRASYIAYYQRAPSGRGQQMSYEPFLFLGDLDGNGLVDILLVTEDAYYGDNSKYNDSPDNRDTDLLDYSTEPLKLKLLRVGYVLGSSDGSIDGSRYSAVILYLNLLFHDNSHPDEQQLEDIDRTDWVLRILLVDEGGNEYIIREYRYQEICNYHKTVVTDIGRDNYFTKLSQSIYIPIPASGKYWVVIALQDPYYYQGTRNDADITIGIEIIGTLPLLR